MKTNPTPLAEKTFACETCATRKKAEANPKSLMGRGYGAGKRAGAPAGKPTRRTWLIWRSDNRSIPV